jgi:hypothetical protein
MLPLRRALALAALALCHPLCPAQDFQDGDFLVTGQFNGYPHAFFAIDPQTGQTQQVANVFSLSGPDWMEYDPFRQGVVLYGTIQPDMPWPTQRLVLVKRDGSYTSLGFQGEQVQTLAPVGDGRIYCQRTAPGGPASRLHVLTANNQMLPVIDPSTGQAFSLFFDHLTYLPAQNALLAVGNGAQGPCPNLSGRPRAFRIPLSPDGLSIAGPISCGVIDFGINQAVVGLDALPGGDYLMTLSNGDFSPKNLVRIQPAGPSLSLFAETLYQNFNLFDLDGGVWSQALGRAVVLSDWQDLLISVPGGNEQGSALSTSLSIFDGTSGTGPRNRLIDVSRFGPGCGGLSKAYGAALAGTGAAAPNLGAASCPRIGQPLPLVLSELVGAAPAFLALGTVKTSLPLAGGTLHLVPLQVAGPVTASGTPGVAAAGSAQFDLTVPSNPALIGVPLYFQGAAVDLGAPEWLSLSKGLEVRAG